MLFTPSWTWIYFQDGDGKRFVIDPFKRCLTDRVTLEKHFLQKQHSLFCVLGYSFCELIFFFFLRLIEILFLDVTLQVVQPVASCSVQHHQVSFTTVQRTLAGNVLCGLVCSATLTRCRWRQSHLVHIGVKPAITSSNTVQAHKPSIVLDHVLWVWLMEFG